MVTSLSLLHLHGQEIQAVLESVRPDQLQQLIVVDIESQLAAALPRFSSLTTLSVSQSSIGIQAVGVAMALPHLLQLRRLDLCGCRRNPWRNTGVHVAGCAMHCCRYTIGEPYEEMPQGGPTAFLEVAYAAPGFSLLALLSGLRPGGVPAIERLRLRHCVLEAATLWHCSMLTALTRLDIADCGAAAGGWDAVMVALLSQAPLLSSLQVESCFADALPGSLITHTGLRQLSLSDVETLPAGPYVASLQQLSLLDARLQQLPPALTAATALTCLEVQRVHYSATPFSTAGMAALLSRLPQLRALQLAHCGLQQLPVQGWPGWSVLQSLDLRSNSLTSLPAELHQATALHHLNLSGNCQLRPTAEQLGALLSHLPLLQGLELSRVGLTELPDQLPPGLRALDVSSNKLQSLPPGLTCQLLTSLTLCGNYGLNLSCAVMERLFARMPRLSDLPGWVLFTSDDALHYVKDVLRQRDSDSLPALSG
ncbi:phospho phosphatase [Chlorella sorokiniana]|uniref:Phospho phosphatase n=1 Tax=Chlorella sorokiniana TaxID=3076 RepID=A0A2P6U5C5_CHLSO|nr:phospho phosphatase [Chlorella sorokiniana]|eukprot:PRW61525.1 phospho phosphatase [Chlorella sorokiniana]